MKRHLAKILFAMLLAAAIALAWLWHRESACEPSGFLRSTIPMDCVR